MFVHFKVILNKEPTQESLALLSGGKVCYHPSEYNGPKPESQSV